MSGLQMRYFVLKPQGDDDYAIASREAMRAYADIIKQTNTELYVDLHKWADEEMMRTINPKDHKILDT